MMSYDIDLTELSAVVSDMAACHRDLTALASAVDAATSAMNVEWSGQARDAHASAHARWSHEFDDMTTALSQLREMADTALLNYTEAVDANVAMWRQVR